MNQNAKDSFELDPAAITLQESLGEGEFGTVYKGVWVSSPQGPLQVAVKSLHKPGERHQVQTAQRGSHYGTIQPPKCGQVVRSH